MSSDAISVIPAIAAIIPAAGVGQRMQADKPKQYLRLQGKTILQHSVERILAINSVSQLYLVLSDDDAYFASTGLPLDCIERVSGGAERVYSVLNALQRIDSERYPWVLVHDAARPLVRKQDIDLLISEGLSDQQGAILACPVRDTMKRGQQYITETVSRDSLWHALTPQFFPTALLREAIIGALDAGVQVTDEAAAMEWAGHQVRLIAGHSDNIKITQPADLQLAAFYLEQQ